MTSNRPRATTLTEADRQALQIRYHQERDKRLRPDGNDQYLEPVGRFSHLLDDPYIDAENRDPLADEVMLAVIGGGFAGLVTAARVKEAGIDDVRIIEKGSDFGGTWYWNRYPGAQCDTAAMIYMPLLEETEHVPTEKYTRAPEILVHCRKIADHYGLYDNACLSTEVTELRWDEQACRWIIRTNRGDEMRAKFVAMGTGPLHRPKLPGIDGIQTFEGHSFHTSRWDYAYTGGSPADPKLIDLADKRVGIIGTGATAVQCVPHLGRWAGQLYVFQRTPSSIDVRNNHPLDPAWFATLEPGWQEEWLRNFTILQTGGFADEDLVMDGWTDIAQRIRDKALSMPDQDFSPAGLLRAYHESDDEKMTEIRARVDAVVEDPVTADRLKPWYRQLCKRPCFHDEYLQIFNRPNVHLIDTDGQGVERIDADGVVASGHHYQLDCLIYASGFEVGTEYARRSGFETYGRDGVSLSQRWADGMVSFHGMHVHQFPNAFIVGHAQAANLISNIPHNLTEAGRTIAAIIGHTEAIGADQVETTAQAEGQWIELLERGGRQFGGSPDCTPGYYNNEGRISGRRELLARLGYPDGPAAYFDYINQWRTSGDFEGLAFC